MEEKRNKLRIEKADIVPVCPHCEKEMDKLIEVNRGLITINRVLCCPHCRKIVGISGQ